VSICSVHHQLRKRLSHANTAEDLAATMAAAAWSYKIKQVNVKSRAWRINRCTHTHTHTQNTHTYTDAHTHTDTQTHTHTHRRTHTHTHVFI